MAGRNDAAVLLRVPMILSASTSGSQAIDERTLRTSRQRRQFVPQGRQGGRVAASRGGPNPLAHRHAMGTRLAALSTPIRRENAP